MFDQTAQLINVQVGGLASFGPGIAGYRSWIVAFAVLLLLAGLARWTMRPTRRRAPRTPSRRPGDGADPAPGGAEEIEGDRRDDDVTRAQQPRKAR